MKKLLKAFTLAEVLITLTIVGVVARLTLPALTQNIQQQTAEASLAKAINTLESVNEKMKMEKGTKTLSRAMDTRADDRCPFPIYYLPSIQNYLNGSYRSRNIVINGSTKSNYPVITTKDGIIITSNNPNATTHNNRNLPARYHGSYVSLLIDTNGMKGPNKIGKDQFIVIMDNYGAIIPYGGIQYAEYNGGNVLWEAGCPSRKDVKPTNPQACTGAIVDNGYKILYGYNSL